LTPRAPCHRRRCHEALAIYLAWLGIAIGQPALPAVVVITVATWITDVFDGYLARRSAARAHTWVGDHDAEADLSVSLGVLFYLALSGYLPRFVLLLGLLIVAVWTLASYQLAWPLYAIPYVALIWVAMAAAPIHAWLAIGYLGLVTIVTWPRLPQQFLPQFFEAVGRLLAPAGSRHDNGSGGLAP
jgi:cardiolipin synthase